MAVDTNFNVKVRIDPEDFPSTDQAVIWDTSSGSFALTSSIGGGIPEVLNPEDNRILTTNNDGSEIWAESYFRWVNDTSVSGSSPGKLIIGDTTEAGDQIVHIRESYDTQSQYPQILWERKDSLTNNTEELLRAGIGQNSSNVVIGFGGRTKPHLIIGEYSTSTATTITPFVEITDGGDVGIGTGATSPTKRLQVTDSVIGETAEITSTNTSNNANGTDPNINRVLTLRVGANIGGGSIPDNPRFIDFQAYSGNPGQGYTSRGHIYLDSAGNANTILNSDKRLKENFQPFSIGLNELLKIQPKEYNWKLTKVSDKGFIAQELYEIYPEAVYKPKDNDFSKDPWGINYTKLIPLLVKSIQDQQDIINELEKRITQLEKNK